MLILCPLVPCNYCLFVFIGFFIASYFYTPIISRELNAITSLCKNPINQNMNKDNLTILIDEKNLKHVNESRTVQFTADGCRYTGFLTLFVISMCIFLFCNTFPEYCIRKRIELNKFEHMIVEKECGCIITYDAINEP